jgi:chromosome segregation ATPase
MRHGMDLVFFSMSVSTLVLFGTVGCATRSDLAKLRQGVESDVKSARNEVRILRGKVDDVQTRTKQETTVASHVEETVKALGAKLEVLGDELISQTAAARKAVDEMEVKRDEEMESVYTELRRLKQQLADTQQERSVINTNMQRMQALIRSLIQRYHTQMENLRAHLQEIEQAARDLEPFADSGQKNR